MFLLTNIKQDLNRYFNFMKYNVTITWKKIYRMSENPCKILTSFTE